ncbi:MAG: YHS domain-containing protein, partial [Candidatus Rokuibacteriota bacterium]
MDSVKDPVCGMDVTPGDAAGGSAEHAGTTYWFCNPRCREQFVAEPKRYLDPLKSAPAGRPSTTDTRIYTSPMHPE